MQQRGMTEVLTSPEIRQALGLTDDQIVEFSQVVSQAEQEMRAQIRAAVQQAREKIVSVLNPQQRSKWQELVGDSVRPRWVERVNRIAFLAQQRSSESDPALRRLRNR